MQAIRVELRLLLGLFITSAFIDTLISYNQSEAWLRFGLVVAGLCLLIAFVRLPEQSQIGSIQQWSVLKWTLLILPVVVTSAFLLTNDWTSRIGGKLPWFDPILDALATWQPRIFNYHPNPNVIGGILAALIPLQVGAFLSEQRKMRAWLGACLIIFSTVGLLLSELRGAWLALVVVATTVLFWRWLGWIGSRRVITRRTQVIVFLIALVAIAIGTLVILLATPIGIFLFDARSDRVAVWRNSFDLVGDYVFTGLGLATYEMAYSSYILLVHVPHTAHAHNLFLDIWLQQGLLGLLAFGGLVIAAVAPTARAVWRSESVSRWHAAALASLAAILLHGLIDDSFYGYAGKGIPFLFIPLGLLFRQTQLPVRAGAFYWAWGLGSIVIVFLGLMLLVPSVRSKWESNLGALMQTRAELSVYHWPEWSIQDELRRSSQIDLSSAVKMYKDALAIDPRNASANRRLGQIELSRGEYDMAQTHLEAAFVVAPDQRATRQMLGELYAIKGKLNEATALWENIDVSNDQLVIREWWYEHIGEEKYASRVKQAARCCGG